MFDYMECPHEKVVVLVHKGSRYHWCEDCDHEVALVGPGDEADWEVVS